MPIISKYWRPFATFILVLSLFAPWLSACADNTEMPYASQPHYLTQFNFGPRGGVGPGYFNPDFYTGYEMIAIFALLLKSSWPRDLLLFVLVGPLSFPMGMAAILVFIYMLMSAGTWIAGLRRTLVVEGHISNLRRARIRFLFAGVRRITLVVTILSLTISVAKLGGFQMYQHHSAWWHSSGFVAAVLTIVVCAIMEFEKPLTAHKPAIAGSAASAL